MKDFNALVEAFDWFTAGECDQAEPQYILRFFRANCLAVTADEFETVCRQLGINTDKYVIDATATL